MAYMIGYDVGSSSIKAGLLEVETGKVVAAAGSPQKEMEIIAQRSGWAEQNPETWWDHLKKATAKMLASCAVDPADIKAIGISYQMHGLVLVDKNKQVLRPAIIWCDSRAVEIGDKAAEQIGRETCLKHLLNLPGNFTASKLKWVLENEPDIYRQAYKAMLPGDYIAMKMTDQIATTLSGLSEAILWDFSEHCLAKLVLDYYSINPDLLADLVPTFSVQGQLTAGAAGELGLKAGTAISYRAGDQPNNALSLNVLNPGEVATTAGTSGVVYGIGSEPNYDPKSRVNTFAHVNHTKDSARLGVLLCVNGTGILNSWLKHNVFDGIDYEQMNQLAATVPVGSDGLTILPFGNGAERTLENRDLGAAAIGWNFNVHGRNHFLRAAQEGIVFALNYGLEIMKKMGIEIKTVRAGKANMFLSPLFAEAFATVTGATVELYDTDGSQGAARGAGFGAGLYGNLHEAFVGLDPLETIQPNDELKEQYENAYAKWENILISKMNSEG